VSELHVAAQDRRSDRKVMIATMIVVFSICGVATVPQVATQAAFSAGRGGDIAYIVGDIGLRVTANIILLLVALTLVIVTRSLDHHGGRLVLDLAIVCAGSATLRAPLQVAIGNYTFADASKVLVETGTVMIVALATAGAGLYHVTVRRRVRGHERASAQQSLRAVAALDALATEELRVRRDVAEGLHGTVQQSLVLLGLRIDARAADVLARNKAHITEEDLQDLVEIRADLDRIREIDVRTMSQLLYPVGLDLGAVAALRMLMQRLPATIASAMHFDDAIIALEGNGSTALPLERRLLIVRVVEEALSNALRHGRASSVALSLTIDRDILTLVFDDDGFGIGAVITTSGIARLDDRLRSFGGGIALSADSALGGTRVLATMPVGEVAP